MTAGGMLAKNFAQPLRVAILAQDPLRLTYLQTVIAGAEHRLVSIDTADVVLADLQARVLDKPTITLVAQPAADNELPLDASQRQIDAALRAASVGLSVRSPGIARHRGFEELLESGAHTLLTPREFDVLNRISTGLGNKAIARDLGISLHTVKFHIEAVFRKLGARTRAEAVAKAFERRIGEAIEL